MSTVVKICGVTRIEDARFCAAEGAELLGLNFWPRSKRCVDATLAAALASEARSVNPSIEVVGVFVNPTDDELERAAVSGLDWIQLHGDESAERVRSVGDRAFKAISVGSPHDVERAIELPGQWLLLDTPSASYGGSGEAFDWSLCGAMKASGRGWLLAGGLNPENVASAIAETKPSGVDVASGVEASPGIKDHSKVRDFIRAAKGDL